MKWRNSKEREMLSSGRDKPSTLPQSPINAEESDDDEINLVS